MGSLSGMSSSFAQMKPLKELSFPQTTKSIDPEIANERSLIKFMKHQCSSCCMKKFIMYKDDNLIKNRGLKIF